MRAACWAACPPVRPASRRWRSSPPRVSRCPAAPSIPTAMRSRSRPRAATTRAWACGRRRSRRRCSPSCSWTTTCARPRGTRTCGHRHRTSPRRRAVDGRARLQRMDRQFRVAVVGATGLVGEAMITVLEERGFPVSQLHALAGNRSVGRSVSFRGRSYPVQELADFDFAHCDFALFSAGAQVSREYAPRAVAAGCMVIDNTSEFRYRQGVPRVVPGANPEALKDIGKAGMVSTPTCSTIQMVMVLKPLHDAAGIERIEVATYQS